VAEQLKDARIRVVIDTRKAEAGLGGKPGQPEARPWAPGAGGGGGAGAGGGAPGGGGGAPGGGEDRGGGTGGVLSTFAAAATAPRKALGFVNRAVRNVFALEGLQMVSGVFAGFFKEHTGLEALHTAGRGDVGGMIRIMIDEALRPVYREISDRIAEVEAAAKALLRTMAAVGDARSVGAAQLALSGKVDLGLLGGMVGEDLRIAHARERLDEAQQRVARGLVGKFLRDRADRWAADLWKKE
jgi:hypothetical protein